MHVTMEVWVATHLLKDNVEVYKPWYSRGGDAEAYFPSALSDITEWLTFLLFAVFSSTYFPEFRDLGVEMNCFSKNHKSKGETVTDRYPMLNRQESESFDEY